MSSIQVTGRTGDAVAVPEATITAVASELDGSLLRPDEDGYAESITLWNAMVAKRPAVVIRAASTRDVVRAVTFAREEGLELSIKGGGHNIAGLSLSEGGVTLDLSGLRAVDVDVERGLARVDPGCTLGDVDRATQAHALATTLGFVSLTGVAGLTVGGGFGYLTRRFGWTVDDLEEVEIVTADSTVRRASRTENVDLFWAIRGGGGNVGVVTEFIYRLHEVGPQVTAGVIAWPAADADRVLEAFRVVTDEGPRELTLAVVRRNAPPAPWLPESAHGTPVIMVVACHSGDLASAGVDLEPITSVGQPLANLIQVKEYAVQQTLLDATMPRGNHYYWKSEFVPGLSDGLIDAYQAQFADLKAPANQATLFHLAGALNEHAEDDGAVGNREAAFACVSQAMWTPDSAAGDANREWVRTAWQAMKPYSTGGNYVNFQTADEPEDRTRAAYGSNFDRLRTVKARYDPENLFRVNRNISG